MWRAASAQCIYTVCKIKSGNPSQWLHSSTFPALFLPILSSLSLLLSSLSLSLLPRKASPRSVPSYPQCSAGWLFAWIMATAPQREVRAVGCLFHAAAPCTAVVTNSREVFLCWPVCQRNTWCTDIDTEQQVCPVFRCPQLNVCVIFWNSLSSFWFFFATVVLNTVKHLSYAY